MKGEESGVALSTENPPSVHSTRLVPIQRMAERSVITIVPQKTSW